MSALPRRRVRRAESGMILLFTLVALVIVLVAGISIVRAMDVTLLHAGNAAFKRDLVNQAERGIAQAIRALNTGALASETTRQTDLPGANYSASRLAVNVQGIPQVLLSDAAFTAAGMTGTDLTDSASGVTVRVVIDRQCVAAGDITTVACATATADTDNAADDRYRRIRDEAQAVYRISVRATGPRGTQAFFQSTVAR
jgi:Tfp pilus assembly protein PilX